MILSSYLVFHVPRVLGPRQPHVQLPLVEQVQVLDVGQRVHRDKERPLR